MVVAGNEGVDPWWPEFGAPADLAVIEEVPLAERGLPASTHALLRHAAQTWPSRPAVSLLPSGEKWDRPVVWTFADLCGRVNQVANVLTRLGVGRRDAVAILAPNNGLVLAALLAAQTVGIAAPLNPGLAHDQIVGLLRLSGARVLVTAGPELDPEVWATAVRLAAGAGLRAVLAVRPDGATGIPPALDGPVPALDGPVAGTGAAARVAYLDELMAAEPADTLTAPDRPRPGDIASYFHTGGTTGSPKLAAHTHANEVVNAWQIAVGVRLADDVAALAGLPLFHVNAVVLTCLAPLYRGQHVVWAGPLGYRDPSLYRVFWKIVERYRVAAMSAVPTVYSVLAACPVDADISTLVLPVVGAAPLPEEIRRGFADRTGGLQLCEGYGLTEATCASARNLPGHLRPGTVGQRLPYQRIRAVRIEADGTWTDLPAGETGALVIAGPNVFPGYLRPGSDEPGSDPVPDPEPEPAGRIADGWLDTGDLGSVGPDGFVRLVGRAKDLIIRGGHNIDPTSIEDVLLRHPDVTAAAAVGRPDAHSGEVPVAYVAVRAGATVAAQDLLEWAAARIPERAAVPKVVHLVDSIPMTLVGKTFKVPLREDAARRAAGAALEEAGLAEAAATLTVHTEGGGPVLTVTEPADERSAARVSAELGRFATAWRFRPATRAVGPTTVTGG
ncbi:fatty-acyl-CoA synthase [Parafrankia irregularis]|uniref:Fatty-acyl-CoA synthase n=1 Tax=Parafrankia irregularis TaxID=795642 RepID=A0A0S4QST3_9ACTN|nr:acyl-CoA synthetase [Parafrankia sp. CH37]CUU58191.1 fatty-acyl-CoA synthase [Parafrankia irregularis]